ncbi:DMT family transporter [Methylotetracoccus oryzae]|uniref:DMT family transporter n=1 Tax=Methylotetracoccus oryzae TaxID=1919059 RepID=UPI001118A7CB|nr:DMT family transporter [Methylotetracoccus oryzae]
MSAVNLLRLLILSAIWGGSFLFMRIGAPVLGPTVLIALRVGLAALFLLIVGVGLRKPLHLTVHWRHYVVLGLLNAALPFLLLAYAAQTISASLLSILNATAPIWSALIGALWMRARLTLPSAVGLILGFAGVALLAGVESVSLPAQGAWAMAAALGAAFSYGIATTYARSAKSVEPFANAHGTMVAATVLMIPLLPFVAEIPRPGVAVVASVAALGVLCSGVAYLLYFRLIAEIGATGALTVTFVIPVFGMLWGAIFLGERIGWHAVLATGVILTGTALANGLTLRGMRRGAKPGQA